MICNFKQKKGLLLISAILIVLVSWGQKHATNTVISGQVFCNMDELSLINVTVMGTTLGTTTDEHGDYQLKNVPIGEITVVVSGIGFKAQQKEITVEEGEQLELNFELEEDILGLEQIVVSADRSKQNRSKAPIYINSLSSRQIENNQSINLGEAINYIPGLQMETNCQSCGFTQVRMNGLPGSYSQILINSRPVFSGLLSVYGLELIPANMIDRIEVNRGGGSAMFGGNAIAGTINIILKEPYANNFDFDLGAGLIGVGTPDGGKPASDYDAKFNTSLVSKSQKTGMAIYGFYRNRDPFDANGDGISEVTQQRNTTIGSQFTHRFSLRSKVRVNFFNINEKRRGGSDFDKLYHETLLTEAAEHNVTSGSIEYIQFFRKQDVLSAYASGQYVDRDSYYGANQSISGYGNTKSFNTNIGLQYKFNFKTSSLIAGIENTSGDLEDIKMGFPDYMNPKIINDSTVLITHKDNVPISDQNTNTIGSFINYTLEYKRMVVSAGLRLDHFHIKDNIHAGLPYSTKKDYVLSPRVNFLYNLAPDLQMRFNYSHGYRAPQMYDEELHVMVSNATTITHKNAPDLKEETSHSFILSANYKNFVKPRFDLLIELFYTKLINPFANEYININDGEFITYRRVNAKEDAQVYGVNLEYNMAISDRFVSNLGFTYNNSFFDSAEDNDFDEKRFFRSPDTYGYFSGVYSLTKSFDITMTTVYTGSMLVIHEGVEIDYEEPTDEDYAMMEAVANGDVIEGRKLEETDPFFDLGLKLTYKHKFNDTYMHFYGGIKNIFNSYQSDHDKGVFRDSAYIYGPNLPRYVYFGIKFSNLL